MSYESWLEAILSARYVTAGGIGEPEYVSALEVTSPLHISSVTHSWLFPFYADNVSAKEFHSELYRLSVDTESMWTLD